MLRGLKSMPKRHAARRGSGRTVLIVWVALLLALSAAIGATAWRMRGHHGILPPETADVVARRHAPENAYFRLEEARKLLPPEPSPQLVPGENGEMVPFVPPRHGIASLLGISRPDDDPEVLGYVLGASEAIEKAREALDAPYFMLPAIDTPMFGDAASPKKCFWYESRLLVDVMLARFRLARVDGRTDEAQAYFNDALRLTALVGEDGGTTTLLLRSNLLTGICDTVVQACRERSPSAHELEGWRSAVAAIDFSSPPRQAALAFTLRSVEHTRIEELGIPYPEGPFQALKIGWEMHRFRHSLPACAQDLITLSAVGPCAFVQACQAGKLRDLRRTSEQGALILSNLMGVEATIVARQRGAILITYIEEYRMVSGHFPASLAELAAQYPDAPTTDGVCEKPFEYRVQETRYLLENPGYEGEADLLQIGRQWDGGLIAFWGPEWVD